MRSAALHPALQGGGTLAGRTWPEPSPAVPAFHPQPERGFLWGAYMSLFLGGLKGSCGSGDVCLPRTTLPKRGGLVPGSAAKSPPAQGASGRRDPWRSCPQQTAYTASSLGSEGLGLVGKVPRGEHPACAQESGLGPLRTNTGARGQQRTLTVTHEGGSSPTAWTQPNVQPRVSAQRRHVQTTEGLLNKRSAPAIFLMKPPEDGLP